MSRIKFIYFNAFICKIFNFFKFSGGRVIFFTLFKLNITFYFKCYPHHNCSINLTWNTTQLYSSAKQLCNVPSSVFWFVNVCFLPFLCKTSVQKWKKNWFCYVHKWIGKKEISTKISKSQPIHRSRNTDQSFVQKSQNLRNFKKVHYFVLKFLDSQHKMSIILWLSKLQKHFRLFDDSANKTKAVNLNMKYTEMRLVFVYRENTECT